jgi:hypothetical protein
MKTAVSIRGVGCILPGIHDAAQLCKACCKTPGTLPVAVDNIPAPEGIRSSDLRRMARLTRLALYAANTAAIHAGVKGQNGGIFLAVTHGSTSLLQEFHNFLFDYGPQMASPNAFSNGVNNAPLAAISAYLGLTRGGLTLVGYENCGINSLNEAARGVSRGTYNICYAGGAEEYSALVQEVYRDRGWYGGHTHSTHQAESGITTECRIAEGSVFFVVSQDNATSPSCLYEPVMDLTAIPGEIDLVISGAGSGPQDKFEIEALKTIMARQKKTPAVIFPKCVFGEMFSPGSLLGTLIGWDILINRTKYPVMALPSMSPSLYHGTYFPEKVQRVLVVAAGRQGEISAGVLWRT